MLTMSDQENLLAAWALPLAGGARAGVDARYDAGYELIRAELAKLDAMSAPPVDWEAVRHAADALLRTRSKDLFVGAALARALHVADGLKGLALGLALIARLAGEFGADLYPTRARARVSALNWLSEQVSRGLADHNVASGEQAVVAALDLHLGQVLEQTRSLLGDDAPSFSTLRDAVARMQLSLPAEAPAATTAPNPVPSTSARGGDEKPVAPPPKSAPTVAPPVVSTAPGVSVNLTPAPAAPSTAAEVTDYLSKTAGSLVEAARVLWHTDRTSPLPYRLLRTGLWLHLESAPAHNAAGLTSIPAPDERLMESLPAMMQHGAFDQLLETSEATLSTARFWLDLHLFCDRALEGLGPTYAAARAAASAGVRSLISRMPMLPSLSFADGTRLARPETVSWLEQLTATGKRAESDTQAADAGGLEGLREALRGAGSREALAALDERRGTCRSARQRFALDLEVAQALVETNRLREARALYEALDAELQRHALETWEPALSLLLLTAYMRCLQQMDKPEQPMSEGLRMLRVRVAKLSPAALVSLGD